MTVKGNHFLAEIIAKKLSGINQVPPHVRNHMVNNAAKAAVEYHETEIERKDEAIRKALILLREWPDSIASEVLRVALSTKEDLE